MQEMHHSRQIQLQSFLGSLYFGRLGGVKEIENAADVVGDKLMFCMQQHPVSIPVPLLETMYFDSILASATYTLHVKHLRLYQLFQTKSEYCCPALLATCRTCFLRHITKSTAYISGCRSLCCDQGCMSRTHGDSQLLY